MTSPTTTTLNRWWQGYHDWLSQFVVTQPFGPTHYGGEPTLFGYPHYHEGVDLGVPYGTPVHNPVPYGRVVKVTHATDAGTGGYGNSVIIATDRGVQILLGHLSSIGVREGQGVAVDDVVGLSGCSGNSAGTYVPEGNCYGPHLHIEARDEQGRLIPIPGNSGAQVFQALASLFGAERPYSGQTNPGPAAAIRRIWSPFVNGPGPHGLPGGVNTTAGGLGAGYSVGNPGANPNTDPSGQGQGQGTTGQGASAQFGNLVAFLSTRGGPLGQALATAANGGSVEFTSATGAPTGVTGDCATAALVLVVAGAGVGLVIFGLYALTREEPVQQVVAPLVEPAAAATGGLARAAGSVAGKAKGAAGEGEE